MTEENYRVGLVPLAFDIDRSGTQMVSGAIIDIEQHILKVVESNQFQDAVKEAARAHWDRTFINAVGGTHHSAEENEKAKAEAIQKAMLRSGGTEALKQAMDSPKGQELKRNMNAFKREFESSPTGVWINENKTKLIVVGALAAIGGACYMYKNNRNHNRATIHTFIGRSGRQSFRGKHADDWFPSDGCTRGKIQRSQSISEAAIH